MAFENLENLDSVVDGGHLQLPTLEKEDQKEVNATSKQSSVSITDESNMYETNYSRYLKNKDCGNIIQIKKSDIIDLTEKHQ